MSELLETGKVSPKKLEANRRNAQLSTGPRTPRGKEWSKRNATKHGILAVPALAGTTEAPSEFEQLLEQLRSEFKPVGVVEDVYVQKIAICWLRQKRALEYELAIVPSIADKDGGELAQEVAPQQDVVTARLRPILGSDLDLVMRYQTTIRRELSEVMTELDERQRARTLREQEEEQRFLRASRCMIAEFERRNMVAPKELREAFMELEIGRDLKLRKKFMPPKLAGPQEQTEHSIAVHPDSMLPDGKKS